MREPEFEVVWAGALDGPGRGVFSPVEHDVRPGGGDLDVRARCMWRQHEDVELSRPTPAVEKRLRFLERVKNGDT